jgi:hypothetical protein
LIQSAALKKKRREAGREVLLLLLHRIGSINGGLGERSLSFIKDININSLLYQQLQNTLPTPKLIFFNLSSFAHFSFLSLFSLPSSLGKHHSNQLHSLIRVLIFILFIIKTPSHSHSSPLPFPYHSHRYQPAA